MLCPGHVRREGLGCEKMCAEEFIPYHACLLESTGRDDTCFNLIENHFQNY